MPLGDYLPRRGLADFLPDDEEERREAARRRFADIRARGDIGTTDTSDPEITGPRSLLYGLGATEKGVARDKAAIADLGFGWVVGAGEKMGDLAEAVGGEGARNLAERAGFALPEGTRAELRSAHQEAQDAYLLAHPEGGVGRAAVEAARTVGAGMIGPQAALGPGLGGVAARGAQALGAGRALAVGAGALGGAAEAAGQSLLDTVDLPAEERRTQVLTGAALGALGGMTGARSGGRRAADAVDEAPVRTPFEPEPPPVAALADAPPPPPVAPPAAGEGLSAFLPADEVAKAEAPPGSTSTANAVTEAERRARNLPEVEAIVRKDSAAWERAAKEYEDNPAKARELARELSERSRPVTAVEENLLLQDRMRIQTLYDEALAEESAALRAGDHATASAAAVRRAALGEAYHTNDIAARRAGEEWSATGRARQAVIQSDFTRARLSLRAENAVRANPRLRGLPADQVEAFVEAKVQPVREQLADTADRLVEAERHLQLYREAALERRAARGLKRETALARKEARKAGRVLSVDELGDEFEALRAEARSFAGTARSMETAFEMAPTLLKMVRNRVKAGALSLQQVVDDVHAAVRDYTDLEPSDIRDLLAEGGPARSASDSSKRMAQIREEARLVRILEAAEQGKPIPTRGGKPRAVPPPELEALRGQVREVLERHGIGPGSEPARLAALKKRLQAAAEREKVTISTGERPAPKARRPPPEFDEDALRLQAEVIRLRHQADTVIRNLELQNRSGLEKAIDWTVGWGRAIKLSSVATATKLVSSGIARTFIFNPLRHAAGAPLTRLPGEYGRFVRERAPIEGGFSGEALVKSWARFFSKDTRAAIWGHLARMEEDPLTLAHGGHSYLADSVKALDAVPKPMKYIAHLLAAYEDTPVKYAAYQYAISKMEKFQRAMEAQGAEILARGGDLTDPLEQLNAQAHAFEYATRQVFMQHDPVVSGFRRIVDRKPGDPAERQILKGFLESQLPILKVPVNMAKERLEYFGPVSLAHGLLRLRRAVKAGVDTIPFDVGDSIVREIKHGSVGTAAALLGWYGYEHFGGYRTPLRPKSDEPHEGEIEVFGVTIPRGLADHPLLMQMQFFATMRKLAERYGKGEFFSEGTGRGAAAAAIGTAKSVPFYDVPFESGKSLENTVSGRGRGFQGFVGAYERGMVLPPDVQRRARIQDQRDEPSAGEQVLQQLGLQRIEARRRTPDDLWEEFLMGVPGARNNVR